MKKNPKMIAGIIGIVVLLTGCIVLATYMIPTIKEVQREMSLTPTPLPPVPDKERLQVLGYYTDAVDGQFGQGTRDAVIAFQKKNGLEADGYAGEETQRVLYSEDAVPNSQ